MSLQLRSVVIDNLSWVSRTDGQWEELQVCNCDCVPLSLIICPGCPIPGIICALDHVGSDFALSC